MRDDDDLGTAADRLPLGGAAEPLVERGWVPHQPVAAAAASSRWPLWAQPWLQPSAARQLGWAAVAALVVLAASAWMLLHRPAPAQVPAPVAAAGAPTPAPVADLQIVVDVGGRVRHPGLVTLPAGARVADALRAAGGALRPADVVTLDLAARVSDGQLLLIGVSQPGVGVGGAGGASVPVSLSSATADQLDALPGIGPVLARRIVDWRTAHGGFTSLSQLQQVPGVGPRIYARLKDLVVL